MGIGAIFIDMVLKVLRAEQTPIPCNYADADARWVILQWVYFCIFMPSRHTKNCFLFGSVPVFWLSCSLLQGWAICSVGFYIFFQKKHLIQSVLDVSAGK